MEGFGGEITFKNYQDDIIPLLEQPDSDSYLSPDVCQNLAEGMELAHQQNEILGFI